MCEFFPFSRALPVLEALGLPLLSWACGATHLLGERPGCSDTRTSPLPAQLISPAQLSALCTLNLDGHWIHSYIKVLSLFILFLLV